MTSSWLTPKARLVPKCHTTTRAVQIRMDCIVTSDHGDVWAPVVFEETSTITQYPAAVRPCQIGSLCGHLWP